MDGDSAIKRGVTKESNLNRIHIRYKSRSDNDGFKCDNDDEDGPELQVCVLKSAQSEAIRWYNFCLSTVCSQLNAECLNILSMDLYE